MSHSISRVEDVFEGFSFNSDVSILSKSSRMHSFMPLVKVDQKSRREELLKKQREERQKLINAIREEVSSEDDALDRMEQEVVPSTDEKMIPELQSTRELNLIKRYRDVLQLPEHLSEIPEDFATAWTAVPFPHGLRCTVVSKNGSTFARKENGTVLIEKFNSLLPGGSYRNNRSMSCFDCIYVEEEQTFYVLDILQWREHNFRLMERDCRSFMRDSKLEEVDGLSKVSKSNEFKFIPLKGVKCIVEKLENITKNRKCEGILFYHDESYYVPERTPLMCGITTDELEPLLMELKKL